MTYEQWKSIKSIKGEEQQKVIMDFERSNPRLAALFEQKEREDTEKMRQIVKEPDRHKRWAMMAAVFPADEDWIRRRQREVL